MSRPTCARCGGTLSITTWTCVRGDHCKRVKDEVVETLAPCIPQDLSDEQAAEHLCAVAPIAGFSLSDVSRRIDWILARSRELKKERADAR